MQKQFYVYILASGKNGTLYTGVTSNLIQRVYQHKNKTFPGFIKEYNIHKLVYFEIFEESYTAISREKRIKKYNRQWKLNLIESINPNWEDLYTGLSE